MSSPVLGTAYVQVPGAVGPSTLADGSPANQRMSHDRTQVVMDGHARFQEAVYRGNVFIAANSAAVTFTASFTTTTLTGLILSNPPNSGKNLVPLQVDFVPNNGAQVAATVGILTMGFSSTAVTHTTALTPINALIGSAANPVGKADSGATLPVAPAVSRYLAVTMATNPNVITAPSTTYLDGSLILAPGTAIAVSANAATTGFVSITWEEIPI